MRALELLKKAQEKNDKIMTEGKWFTIIGTNIDLLLKPGTARNKEYTKNLVKANLARKYGEKWDAEFATNENLRKEWARVLFGCVVCDYRYTDTQSKDGDEEMTADMLAEFFAVSPAFVDDVNNIIILQSKFEIVDEESSKN